MPCGCQSTCGCNVVGDGSTTSVVRVGDTFTVSSTDFIESVADTDCIDLTVAGAELSAELIIDPDQECVEVSCGPDGLRADLTIDPDQDCVEISCGPAGLRADITLVDTDCVMLDCTEDGLSADIIVDPDSPTPISCGPNGLSVDAVAASIVVDDTDTVDLTLTGPTLTADVIPNEDAGLENQASGVSIKLQDDPAQVAPTQENRIRFSTAGDLTFLQDGVNIVDVGDSSQVDVPISTTDTAVAESLVLTNTDDTAVVAIFESFLRLQMTAMTSTTTSFSFGFRMRHELSALAGGAVAYGNSGDQGISASMLEAPSFSASPSGVFEFGGYSRATVLLPPGASVTIEAVIESLRNISVSSWETAVGDGSFFQAVQSILRLEPARLSTARSYTLV